MAHECPDCGQSCHCNGDIDDCFFENTYEQLHCKHCPLDQDMDDDYEGEVEEGEANESK